jgi:hypothetical protein
MPLEKLVHADIDPTNLTRILADQAFGNLDKACASAFSISQMSRRGSELASHRRRTSP